ncbi:MAG: bifunctional [glutamate--ammonia ligase]-adenylyl-L-tyrosine phosphorylase/[glutamate--ammonia-ligase] adenylyltransferase [Burkholderiales bacterium]|nr:bifunctional [glutamate--ammonia ligase]-adenylyl-L-tyrosine phosphorylase/[glutamate--ammonia-ligase] adenylyltransferase [Burkholderiales bacterium]
MNDLKLAPPALAEHSRFVQRIRRRYGPERDAMPAGAPDTALVEQLVQALLAAGRTLPSALRVARHLVIERLAVLDVEQGAPLETVTRAMTELAEVALERALAQARDEEGQRHGQPRTAAGHPIELWVVGMGKLGSRELNVSSDIDLVYVYEEEGQTDGPVPISAHEYFSKVVKRIYSLIGDVTEDGFVFRVDLALRPNGNSGPPVVSLAMLEDYLHVQGREWERLAWLKSRVVAPRAAVTSGRAQALGAAISPFVYRKYLDYGVFEGLRQLHRKIRDEAQRRAAGRPERANDVKLSRGGIREIEFIVQLLLVVRGGHFPEIRSRSTLKSLSKLVAHGLMRPQTAERLGQAYVFLRRIEHRIQYLDDQQTHLLPSVDGDLAWIGASMGLPCNADACALLEELGLTREFVAGEFDALLHDGRDPGPNPQGKACVNCNKPLLPVDAEAFIERMPAALQERLRIWSAQTKVAGLKEASRMRLARLMQRAEAGIEAGDCTEEAALRFLDWLDPLLRRETYLTLLVERPEVQRRLLRLLGLARWPMRYLLRHPGVIDELADERQLRERFDREEFTREMQARHAAWVRSGEASEEALLDTLRRAHHAEVFRTLVRDVEGRITVEQVADDLSALADTMIELTMQWAWSHFKQRHRSVEQGPGLAVIAYGKLGGKELGYGGDLDLVFLYEDEDEHAQEVYGAFVRKLITWLTLRTNSGELFDIDTALRPNGNSGLLVTSMDAFERYQLGRGSNTAWTWEHQAITRARWCAGVPALASRFERVRRGVLCAPREPAALREEVHAMREKVRQSRPVPEGRFDVKHSAGGMMDAEFAVQLLVLTHSATHEALQANSGNIALLHAAEACGLLPAGVGMAAADAYRELRRAQHRARLDEQATQFDPVELAGAREAVLALWKAVFG